MATASNNVPIVRLCDRLRGLTQADMIHELAKLLPDPFGRNNYLVRELKESFFTPPQVIAALDVYLSRLNPSDRYFYHNFRIDEAPIWSEERKKLLLL